MNLGDTVAERFTLKRVIGEGGMGIVYEALDTKSDRMCALKILSGEYANHPNVIARFDREARVAAKLTGPNVARVFDVGALPNGVRYIAMELLVGKDVAAELAEHGRLPVARAVDIVVQAAHAMSEAHALGVIHRDLKPANLFLVESGVKVLDFGISRLYDDEDRLTTDFSPLGTAVYMSPEQIESAARVDERTDIWALGICLYEMLTGRPPFDGQNTAVLVAVATRPIPPPSTVVDDLPRELESVVMKALAKKPEERFQSMVDFARALAPWTKRAKRRGSRALLWALAALVLLGFAAYTLDARSLLRLEETTSTEAPSASAMPSAKAPSSARASASAAHRAPPHGSHARPTQHSSRPTTSR